MIEISKNDITLKDNTFVANENGIAIQIKDCDFAIKIENCTVITERDI